MTTIIIIGLIVGILLVTIEIIILTKNERQREKEYQEYVESVRIGDTFGHNCFRFSNIDDPFSEDYNKHGFDPDHCVTILDIKKNNKGKTWVKYCFTRVLNAPHCEWTDEMKYFLEYRTRISRRIDNINTNE